MKSGGGSNENPRPKGKPVMSKATLFLLCMLAVGAVAAMPTIVTRVFEAFVAGLGQ
jgi:hypothetical protein